MVTYGNNRTGGPPGATRPTDDTLVTAAAVCAALCLVASGLWIVYLVSVLRAPGSAVALQLTTVLPLGVPMAAVGLLAVAHRPRRGGGWVLIAVSLAMVVPKALGSFVWVHGATAGELRAVLAVWFVGFAVTAPIAYLLPFWFPDGRLPGTAARCWAVAVVVWCLPQALQEVALPDTAFGRPSPLSGGWAGDLAAGTHDRLGGLQDNAGIPLVAVACLYLVWCTTPAYARRRTARAAPVPRRRITLVLLAAYTVWAGVKLLTYYTGTTGWTATALLAAGAVQWPVALAYVVTRDTTYRVSRRARSLFAALLVATVLTVLFVVLTDVLARALAPGDTVAAAVLVACAMGVGAALRPLATWALRVVDRLYYGQRAHPYEVLRTLARRMSQAVGAEEAPATLCATVAETLRLPGAALFVHTRSGPRELASSGDADGFPLVFPLMHNGVCIGDLRVAPRDGEHALDPRDAAILRSLADQAAPSVASLRLLEDLQASREQIVIAREEERRRLRRDIHDGLGPALSGLRLRVDSAGALLPQGDAVARVLDGVSADLELAVRDVRRITDGLGPAAVGEHGLCEALRHLGSTFHGEGLTVTADFTPDPLPELSAALEVAVYRIAAEALNNVVRHARAGKAALTVSAGPREVVVTVHDDGVGAGTVAGPGGVGLRSMADRAAELGGTCTMTGTPAGTCVHAVLPRVSARMVADPG